jgi:predicted dehydrogenase
MSDGISRRDAALVIAAAPALARAAAPVEQVAFALIGAGAWGRQLLTHANRVAGARCLAVCDPDESNLRQAAAASRDKPQTSRDYRAALDRKDVQAVLVATPLHMHFPIVRDALLARKHVHCEPPLVFKPEEVEALREVASRADQVVQVGFQRRYSKFYQTAKQMVSKGFLGDVTNIQAQWHRAPERSLDPERPKETNWRYFREFSGGHGFPDDVKAQAYEFLDAHLK